MTAPAAEIVDDPAYALNSVPVGTPVLDTPGKPDDERDGVRLRVCVGLGDGVPVRVGAGVGADAGPLLPDVRALTPVTSATATRSATIHAVQRRLAGRTVNVLRPLVMRTARR
jgi:hypothetical protein